jgi:hypothetical protein
MPYDSCLTLLDVNKMYTLWYHDFTSNKVDELTHFSHYFIIWTLLCTYEGGKCVFVCFVSPSMCGRDLVTSAIRGAVDTQSFCMSCLPFCALCWSPWSLITELVSSASICQYILAVINYVYT